MKAPRIRPQYHFRESERGLLAWDVRRLIALASDLPVQDKLVSEISELDSNHWYTHAVPTCRSIIEHLQLIQDADLSYPIILNQAGGVMDGMHRVCKAAMLGIEKIQYVQFEADPEPDYVGRHPSALPYNV